MSERVDPISGAALPDWPRAVEDPRDIAARQAAALTRADAGLRSTLAAFADAVNEATTRSQASADLAALAVETVEASRADAADVAAAEAATALVATAVAAATSVNASLEQLLTALNERPLVEGQIEMTANPVIN
jgi:hypothetical protein